MRESKPMLGDWMPPEREGLHREKLLLPKHKRSQMETAEPWAIFYKKLFEMVMTNNR